MSYAKVGFLWLMVVASTSHAACSLNVTGVNFGSYDVFDTTPIDSTGMIDVSCLPRAAIAISFSTGIGTYANRRMAYGSYRLNYNIYRNSARNRILGDGSAGTVMLSANNIRNRSFVIYGRLFAKQNVSAGLYADTLVVTVTF